MPRRRCFRLPSHNSILFLSLLLIPASVPSQTDDNRNIFELVDTYITAEAAGHSFRGAVLVGMNGKVVFEKAYGIAERAQYADYEV